MIKHHSVVSIHYELKNADGDDLDSSKGNGPLVYLQGADNIISGLEEQLMGKAIGDEFDAVIPTEKAYGLPVAALIQTVPRAAFGDEIERVEVGMRFQAETERGPMPVVVTAMDEDTVTVDGNHPLAGQELHFKVSVADVRKATDEEIEHGHAHGPGGHQH